MDSLNLIHSLNYDRCMKLFLVLLGIGGFIWLLSFFIHPNDQGEGYAFLGSETLTVIFWIILALVLGVIFASF